MERANWEYKGNGIGELVRLKWFRESRSSNYLSLFANKFKANLQTTFTHRGHFINVAAFHFGFTAVDDESFIVLDCEVDFLAQARWVLQFAQS